MEKIKVSIIVPVYKVEKYLRRSMDSLVNQTLKKVEIICINDGSPDNCLSILKEYKEKYTDKNIIIIDKQNEGVWKARFDGIKQAKGEYIGFVDSDDYVTLDYAEKLYQEAIKSNSDIVVCGFHRIDTETEHVYSTEMTKFSDKIIEIGKNPEELLSVNTALWNKLYKSELLKKMQDIKNPPKVLEDTMFLLLNYMNMKKVTFIKESLYYYMVRQKSAMTSVNTQQIIVAQSAMEQVKQIYEKKNDKSMLDLLTTMAFLHFGVSLMFRMSYDKKNFKQILKENRRYLDEKFPLWRKSEYLNVSYSLSHGANLKVAIVKKLYILHLYRAFLAFYRFIIETLKIDIKW